MQQFRRQTQFAALVWAFASQALAARAILTASRFSNRDVFGCHNAKVTQSKLDLTERETALRGGERGPALIAGDAQKSPDYQFASRQLQPFMPPAGDPLTAEELKTLAAWIDSGASWPGGSLFTSDNQTVVRAEMHKLPSPRRRQGEWARPDFA